MNFDSAERELLGRLADELIPAADNLPSASQAGVSGEGLSQVLAVRPELAEPLRKALHAAHGKTAGEAIAHLRCTDAPTFGALAEWVSGAYFLNAQVRAQLSYAGQGPRPLDSQPDYLEDGLLEEVIKRGPIYRRTPPQ